jgi:hypothetical protein
MVNDHCVKIAGISERPTHDLRVGDALGAVGEGNGAGGLEQADLGHFLALESLGDRRHRVHVHDGVVARAAQHKINRGRVIDRRRRIGLTDNGRNAAGRRGLAGRGKGLAAGFPGFADEGAHVDQARRDHFAAAIDDISALGNAGGADAFLGSADDTFRDQKIADDIEIARRIDDAGIGKQDRAAVGEHHELTLSFRLAPIRNDDMLRIRQIP